MRAFWLWLILALSLAGCRSRMNAAPSASPPTVPANTIAAPSLLSPPATASLTPSHTHSPTHTPSPQPSFTPTPTLSQTPTLTPAPWGQIPLTADNIGALAQLGEFGLGVLYSVQQLSDSGNLLAVSSLGLYLYERDSYRLLIHLPDNAGYTLTKDGSQLLSWDRTLGDIQVWDTQAGSLVVSLPHALPGLQGQVQVGEDVVTGLPVYSDDPRFSSLKGVVTVAFSPQGDLFAACYTDQSISLWDTQTWKEVRTLTSNVFPDTQRMVFSSDGAYLVTSGQALGLWRVADGELIRRRPNAGNISAAPFSPAGKLLVTSSIGAVQVWSLPDLALLYSYRVTLYEEAVFSQDSRHLILNGYKVWQVSDGSRLRPDKEKALLEAEAAAHPPVIEPLVEASPEVRQALEQIGHYRALDGLKIESQGQLIVWSVASQELRWIVLPDGTTGSAVLESEPMSPVQYSAQNRAFLACYKTALLIIPAAGGETLRLPGCRPSARLALRQDGQSLARANGMLVDIVSLPDGAVTNNLRGHTNNVVGLAESADGRIIASGSEVTRGGGEVFLWKIEPFSLWQRWKVTSQAWGISQLSLLRFSPDGNYLLIGGADSYVKLYRVKDGWQLRNMIVGGQANAAAFSPQGDLLAVGDTSGILTIWSIPEGEKLLDLRLHRGAITGLEFSSDGTTLVSASEDGTGLVWGISIN